MASGPALFARRAACVQRFFTAASFARSRELVGPSLGGACGDSLQFVIRNIFQYAF
jgi:hypothetical protein